MIIAMGLTADGIAGSTTFAKLYGTADYYKREYLPCSTLKIDNKNKECDHEKSRDNSIVIDFVHLCNRMSSWRFSPNGHQKVP